MNTHLRQFLPCLATCAFVLSLPRLWSQTPGTLDTSFGNGGVVLTLADPAAEEQYTSSVVLQADGKILTGGSGSHKISSSGDRYILRRYNADGSPDFSFGGGDGRMSNELDGYWAGIYTILPQANGEIITVGDMARDNGGASDDFDHLLMRFLPDGSPKTSFGQDGVSLLNWSSVDLLVDGAVLPDGMILGAGCISEGDVWKAAVIRCLADGSRDPSFGSGGALTFSPTPGLSEAYALALQPDGKAVIAGPAWSDDSVFEFPKAFLARCTADGKPDATFGSGGMALHPSPDETYTRPNDIAVLPDGKIVLCGERNGGLWAARFLANGDRDTSFGPSNGEVTLPISNFFVESPRMAHLSDGGLLIAAGLEAGLTYAGEERLLLLRLTPDGALHTAFGAPNGYVVQNPAGEGYGFSFSDMALQSDGRVVVVGDRVDGQDDYVMEQIVARYHVDDPIVLPVALQLSISLAENTISLAVAGIGQQGWRYEIQRSPNLGVTPWTAVHSYGPLTLGGPVAFSFSEPAAASQAFYRVVVHAP